MTAEHPPLPTFLIIGAQKSATRWLRSHLGEHPDVFTSDAEISYFNHDGRYALGTEWYRSQFREWSGEQLIGESTPGYLMWRHDPGVVAERIRATVPDVRLIAVVRDPVDRAASAVVHHQRHERIRASASLVDLAFDVDAATDRLGIIAGGWYASSLRPFVELFGEQLLVLLHDDVRDQPGATYRRTLEHIGASDTFAPTDLAEVRYSNKTSGAGGPTLAERERVLSLYSEEISRLEEMLGRDLMSWRVP